MNCSLGYTELLFCCKLKGNLNVNIIYMCCFVKRGFVVKWEWWCGFDLRSEKDLFLFFLDAISSYLLLKKYKYYLFIEMKADGA